MDLKMYLRRWVVEFLAQRFEHYNADGRILGSYFRSRNHRRYLDHIAIYDLPGQGIGLRPLVEMFQILGFKKLFIGEVPSEGTLSAVMTPPKGEMLPYIVLNEFQTSKMDLMVQKIVTKVASDSHRLDISHLKSLAQNIKKEDYLSAVDLFHEITRYLTLSGGDTLNSKSFEILSHHNSKLAKVCLAGRDVDHIGYYIPTKGPFTSLEEFMSFASNHLKVLLERRLPLERADLLAGIEQKNTLTRVRTFELKTEKVVVPFSHAELVWKDGGPNTARDLFLERPVIETIRIQMEKSIML